MNRQELLLNLTLITVIGALGYSIYDARQGTPDLAAYEHADAGTEAEDPTAEEGDTATETTYDPSQAKKKYPNVGNKDLFKAIITPTPSPPPPTPTPAPTPNINQALNAWKLLAVDRGMATIEDVTKSRVGAEDSVFDMKPGDSHPVDIGGGQVKNARLEKTDEVTNPDVPTATFSMEGTKDQRTLKMGEEAGALAVPAGNPGNPTPPANQ